MARRLLQAPLVFAALLSDLEGNHAVALAFLLLAIPAAFVLALDLYGDWLVGRSGGLRPLAAGLSVVLLVISAALRSPAVVGGVPHFAVSALVLTLLVYTGLSIAALLPVRAVPESA